MLNRWQAEVAALLSKRLLLPASILVIFIFGYLWRLGSLLPGASADELASLKTSRTFSFSGNSLIDAPYHLLQRLLLYINLSDISAARLTSVLIMLIFGGCFYYVVRCWFGRPTAIFAILLFLTNPYNLIVGRTATPRILLYFPVALAAVFSWALLTERRLLLAWIIACLTFGLSLYTPGLVWILLPALFFCRPQLLKITKSLPKKAIYIGMGLVLVSIVPLVYSIVAGNTGVRSILRLPAIWHGPLQIAKFFAWSIASLFIRTPVPTSYNLGHSPVLNIVEVALLFFGLYALSRRLARGIYLMAGLVAPALVLVAINQNITALYLTIPIFITLAAVGVRFLYIEWRSVFPVNPLPRYLALVLISLVLLMHVVYGLRYALVAWPHNQATKIAYMLK